MSGTANWHGRNTKYSSFEPTFKDLLSNIYFISIKVGLGELFWIKEKGCGILISAKP